MKPFSILSQLFFSALVLFSVNSPAADIEQLDRIVAIVDRGVVTEQELKNRIQSVSKQFAKAGNPLPTENVLRKQILERLISDSLQLQFAEKTGLTADKNQVNLAVERIAEQNNLTLTEFAEKLQEDNISMSRFRVDIKNQLTMQRIRDRQILSRVKVTETEIDNLLTTQDANPAAHDEYEIAHILIHTPEESAPADIKAAKAKAKKAIEALQNGENFAQVSAKYSDASNAIEGGSLGWKQSTDIPALFLNALKPLQVGEFTELLRSPNGYHILMLTNKRGDDAPLMVEQTNARHILVKLSEITSDKEAKHKIDRIKERLDNNEDFIALARQYSDDGSASNGGDLGWVNPGDTVAPFEKAMNALQVNEISEPVKSQFGWHIIQVIARRSQDMTNEARRLKARQQIRNRKAEEKYQDWLREMRDRAYVEIKLDDDF